MKNTLKNGFTLIELLVVVLIIGVLASVALPQYTKAVNKSRAAGYWPMLKNFAEAARLCQMEKGSVCDIDELDIELPQPCKPLPGNTCEYGIGDNHVKIYLREMDLGVHFQHGRFCNSGMGASSGCKKYGMGDGTTSYFWLDDKTVSHSSVWW